MAIGLVMVVWLVWRSFGDKRKPGCGGGGGGLAGEFKEKLKR